MSLLSHFANRANKSNGVKMQRFYPPKFCIAKFRRASQADAWSAPRLIF